MAEDLEYVVENLISKKVIIKFMEIYYDTRGSYIENETLYCKNPFYYIPYEERDNISFSIDLNTGEFEELRPNSRGHYWSGKFHRIVSNYYDYNGKKNARKGIEMIMNAVEQAGGHYKQNDNIRNIVVKCESKLEEKFIVDFINYCKIKNLNEKNSGVDVVDIGIDGNVYVNYNNGANIKIIAQCECGQYRIDFYFECLKYDTKKAIAVEIDGHEFHEKTEVQATRDNRRDRYLQKNDIQVWRYTGRDVHRDDKFKIAKEIYDYFLKI